MPCSLSFLDLCVCCSLCLEPSPRGREWSSEERLPCSHPGFPLTLSSTAFCMRHPQESREWESRLSGTRITCYYLLVLELGKLAQRGERTGPRSCSQLRATFSPLDALVCHLEVPSSVHAGPASPHWAGDRWQVRGFGYCPLPRGGGARAAGPSEGTHFWLFYFVILWPWTLWASVYTPGRWGDRNPPSGGAGNICIKSPHASSTYSQLLLGAGMNFMPSFWIRKPRLRMGAKWLVAGIRIQQADYRAPVLSWALHPRQMVGTQQRVATGRYPLIELLGRPRLRLAPSSRTRALQTTSFLHFPPLQSPLGGLSQPLSDEIFGLSLPWLVSESPSRGTSYFGDLMAPSGCLWSPLTTPPQLQTPLSVRLGFISCLPAAHFLPLRLRLEPNTCSLLSSPAPQPLLFGRGGGSQLSPNPWPPKTLPQSGDPPSNFRVFPAKPQAPFGCK